MLLMDVSYDSIENNRQTNIPVLYSNTKCNIHHLISLKNNNELLDERYKADSLNEICLSKLDRKRIDKPMNNSYSEICLFLKNENTISKRSYEKAIKNNTLFSKNVDKSPRNVNRKKKRHRGIPKGIIIDFNSDIDGNRIKIEVISMHNLMSKRRYITIPKYTAVFNKKKHPRSFALRNYSSKEAKVINIINSPILSLFYVKHSSKLKNDKQSTKHKHKDHEKTMTVCEEIVKAMDNKSSDINTQNETKRYCCHGETMIDVNKEQQRILCMEKPYINERKYTDNFCCFNDNYHISNHKNCQNGSIFNFNTEMQTDCTAQHFHPEDTRLKIYRSCIPSEYYPDENMQRDYCLNSKRAARLFENSVPVKVHQRREIERTGSNGFQKNITSAFATKVDEDLSKLKYCDLCGNFDRKGNSASTIQKCTMSKASIFVESGRSIVDLRDFSLASARCKIDMHPAQHSRTMVEERDERPNKSNSQKTTDTWRSHAREIARASRSDQFSWKKTEDFVRGMDSKWKRDSIEIDAQQSDYKWESRIATRNTGVRTNMDFKEQRDPTRPQTKNVKANANCKYREACDYFSWTSLQIGKICSQIHDACKNVVKFVTTSSIAKDVPKLGHTPGEFVEIGEETLVENSKTPFTDKIYSVTSHKNLMHLNDTKRSGFRQECVTIDMEKHGATERSMQRKGKEIEDTYIFYGEHEQEGYRKVPEFLLSHATWHSNSLEENGQNKNIYPQSLSSESFTYLKVPMCKELRNRGGSDGNQDPTKNTKDKRKSMEYTGNVEETKVVVVCHKNSNAIKCTRNIKDRELREHQIQNSHQTAPTVYHMPSFTTHACDSQVIYVDASDISLNDSSHSESPIVNPFILEDNIGTETSVRSTGQTASSVKVEAYKNIEYPDDVAETEKKNLRSETAEIVFARVSPVEINKPDDESIASTSKCNTPLVSSENESRSSRYVAAIKFWRKRSAVISNKINSLLFKRKENAKKNESSSIHNDGMKITQVETSTTVQATQKSDKGYSDVNVQMQTFDTIVTRILSEFLVSGQKKKKVLMTIMLESQSDSDVLHKETQTSSSNDIITPVVIDPFDYTDKSIPHTMMTSSRIVQCFTCAKKDCYEIKHSDDSITLEEAIITEYPETSEFNGSYFAKAKSDIEISP